VDKGDFFIDEILIQNSFGTVEDYCRENQSYYDLCRAALIMNKRDKFDEYLPFVDNAQEKKKLVILSQ
jgi:hypothetical protein